METRRAIHKTEAFKMLSGFVAVLVLGFGTATAAISFPEANAANPALRPLATGPSVQIQTAAYGEDDEDCVWVTAKTVQPNGKIKLVRKLECAE